MKLKLKKYCQERTNMKHITPKLSKGKDYIEIEPEKEMEVKFNEDKQIWVIETPKKEIIESL